MMQMIINIPDRRVEHRKTFIQAMKISIVYHLKGIGADTGHSDFSNRRRASVAMQVINTALN
jgi:hypothetical protein